jgi:hypothetical protein
VKRKNKLVLCHLRLGEIAVFLYVLCNYVFFVSLPCKREMIHFISSLVLLTVFLIFKIIIEFMRSIWVLSTDPTNLMVI